MPLWQWIEPCWREWSMTSAHSDLVCLKFLLSMSDTHTQDACSSVVRERPRRGFEPPCRDFCLSPSNTHTLSSFVPRTRLMRPFCLHAASLTSTFAPFLLSPCKMCHTQYTHSTLHFRCQVLLCPQAVQIEALLVVHQPRKTMSTRSFN